MRSVVGSLFCFCALLWVAGCRKPSVSLGVFREMATPVQEDLSSVWFLDDQKGYITGGNTWVNGLVLSTIDGGNTWKRDSLQDQKLERVFFTPSGRGFACGLKGGLFELPVGSQEWRLIRNDWVWYHDCYFFDDGHGIAVSGQGFRNGGIRRLDQNIQPIDTMTLLPNELNAVVFTDSLTAFACGMGWLLRSDDGGQTWERLPVTGDFFKSICFTDPQTGYIVGITGTLLRTTDGGRAWQSLRNGNSVFKRDQPFRAIRFADANRGYIVGEGGLFWRTLDAGNSWAEVEDVPEIDLTDIFVRGNKGWITATGGRAFYFEE